MNQRVSEPFIQLMSLIKQALQKYDKSKIGNNISTLVQPMNGYYIKNFLSTSYKKSQINMNKNIKGFI